MIEKSDFIEYITKHVTETKLQTRLNFVKIGNLMMADW